MDLLRPDVRVHLIGIGGIGLSAIARVLHGWGYQISGSDLQESALTEALREEGMVVYQGHRAENLGGVEEPAMVVMSSAVPEDNPEVLEARRRGWAVLKRQRFLRELTTGKTTVAVAGTHGKTTTTAMIAWILTAAGLDPSYIVGGVLQNLGRNARAGTGSIFVIEADEYDGAFLGLRPDIAVLTTLEHDHPDCYPTFDDMRTAFTQFAEQIVKGGLLIACHDDPGARKLASDLDQKWLQDPSVGTERRIESYGGGAEADWQAADIELAGSPTFLVRHGGHELAGYALQLPGHHNVLNALAALAACAELGVDLEQAAAALTRFRGTERRFEVKGQVAGVTVVDDYAHHPTEIRATLSAARMRFPGQTVWAVFQPHTYSRTVALLGGFASAFRDADQVVVTQIYSAREHDTLGVSGSDVVDEIIASGWGVAESTSQGNGAEQKPGVLYIEPMDAVVTALVDRVRPGDVIITMGAGDGHLIGERLLEILEARVSAADLHAELHSGTGTAGSWRIMSSWTH